LKMVSSDRMLENFLWKSGLNRRTSDGPVDKEGIT